MEFHFQGPIDFEAEFPELPLITYPAVPFADYLDVIQGINADIAIAPLRPHLFNMSKSNLKFLQMTLMEAAFVGSNFGPYATLDHGSEALLAKSNDDWVKHLMSLVNKEDQRKKLVANALKYVNMHYMIEKNLHCWINIFNQLLWFF